MSGFVITIGWLGFAGGLIYFIVEDHSGAPALNFVHSTQHILIISAVVVLAGYLFKYLGRSLGVGSSRCRTCGKRIDRQEMYCFDHRLETIRKAQEQNRIPGSGKKN